MFWYMVSFGRIESDRDLFMMSIRRTQKTVETLWKALEMQGVDPMATQRHDPEVGEVQFEYKGKPCRHEPSMDPPRLTGHGCCARLGLMLFCSLCCLIIGALFISLANLPAATEARSVFHEHIFKIEPVAQTVVQRRSLPAILRRFGAIKRARPPERGVDRSTIDSVFPHWKGGPSVAVEDISLAISAIVDQLDPNEPYQKDTNASAI